MIPPSRIPLPAGARSPTLTAIGESCAIAVIPSRVLAEHCTFLEVAYLLLFGELPTASELKDWVYEITHHTMLHETTKKFMEGFRYNAHPMAMLVSTVAALSTVYPERKNIHDPANRLLQIKRLIGKMPSDRGHVVSPHGGIPVRLSRQRSDLHGKLHEHAVEDGRAEICGQSGHCAGARRSFCLARRPRAELQH